MFSFTKTPETELELNCRLYKLNLAFDVVLSAFAVAADDDLSLEEQTDRCFDLLVITDGKYSYEKKIDILQAIFEYVKEQPYGLTQKSDEEIERDKANGEIPKPVIADFDWEQDAAAVYASFFSQYGIDLDKERGIMHWDKFKALFDGLDEKSQINRIRGYRNDDLTSYDENQKDQLALAAEMKHYYRIKNEQQDENGPFSADAGNMFESML